jgi:centrosomal protein CEP290
MESFSVQLEERILTYKSILDEKQRELDVANEKYADLVDQIPGIDMDGEQSELKRLMESLKDRDELIKAFDEKIGMLSAELVDSTSIITKINDEKEDHLKRLARDKNDRCCEEVQTMLERSKIRCLELQEMLELAENDNMLKAKQAFEAIETLKSYENSENGLADALKKIHQLQENVHKRDKQIHDLVVELNDQNEVVAENVILRKRCGIPDDDVLDTKAFLAKQKKFSKVNDRLMLKLRASEEYRLQLKIDKNDLKRRIDQLESQLGDRSSTLSGSAASVEEPKFSRKASSPVEIKNCQSCFDTYNVFDSVKFCKNCIMKQNSNLCDNCVSKFKVSSDENIELIKKITKLEIDHQSVTEENENLRVGLNEILEKLRDYEGNKVVLFSF